MMYAKKKKKKKYENGGKVDPPQEKPKGVRVFTFNGSDYELNQEQSDRYDKLKERERIEYVKKHGNSKESMLDFDADFLGGSGSKYIQSGNYKKPLEESDKEFQSRSFDAWKSFVKNSDDPQAVLDDPSAMENFIKSYIKDEKRKTYSKGGIMQAKKKEYSKGGMMEYKKGGKLGKRKALDFNKDGKITKEDFAMLRGMAKNKKKKGKKVPKAAVGMALAGVAKIAAPLIKKAVIGSAVNAVKKGVDKQVNKAIG